MLFRSCDSDGDRHETVYGKWYPQHCSTTSEMVWNEELMAWTVDVRIGGLYIMYVDKLEDANYGTVHELVEDITTVFTTLVWDAENAQWNPVEPIELHTTCRTAPVAPVHKQMASYQIKVYGDVHGVEKAYTTSIPEGAYTMSEVYGSREEGFFVDITVTLEDGDIYAQTWLANRYPGGFYEYDWSKTAKTVTFTLKYNGSLNGTLYGDRHSNYAYDWVLSTNDAIYGVVSEAYLVPMQFVLTLNPNGGQVDPETVTVTFGKAIGTLPVPTRTGYTFAGWFDAEGKEVTAETVYTIGGDSTVTAKWTANEYTLTLDANKGEVDPATVTVTFDAAIGTLPVPTRTGYTFAGWFDAQGNQVTAETVYTIDGDSTVTAKWTANEYTLTLDANGGAFMMTMTEDAEVITTLTITVVYDQPVGELPVPERAGYTFNGWFDEEGNEVTADTVYTTAGDMTVTAKWTANKYTITLNPNYGKVDPKSLEATYDEAIGKLPKPTREGFIFTFWRTEDGTMVTEETIYNVAGDITLYAEWRTASPADSPATGDGMILFAFVTMLISAGALLFLMERKRRVQA